MCEILESYFDAEENIYDEIDLSIPEAKQPLFKSIGESEAVDDALTDLLRQQHEYFKYCTVRYIYNGDRVIPRMKLSVQDVAKQDKDLLVESMTHIVDSLT